MKKLLLSALLLAILAAGCAQTDYPVITDARGSYTGVIRTGHKAYIVPTSQVATIWNDGSDELFSMVYQAQNGDQTIYTFNNYDPSGVYNFLDQQYCDWRYSGCEMVRAWNPVNAYVDDPFDYEFFPQCSGARSLSLLVSNSSRTGECGDRLFASNRQALFAEFADLATTTWRGAPAYILPVDASNTVVTLTNSAGVTSTVPIYGSFNGIVTDRLQTVFPMTPNARHELRWLSQFVAENGNLVTASINYGSLDASVSIALAVEGINYNLDRF